MREKAIDNELEIDLVDLIIFLAKKAWIILSIAVIVALSCYYIMQTNMKAFYKADTTIYILYRENEKGVSPNDIQAGTFLTSDYKKLIKSHSVLDQVINTLSLDYNYDELSEKTEVEVETDTRIITISVKDADPYMAMEVANMIREVATDYINKVMKAELVMKVDAAQLPENPIVKNSKKAAMIGGMVGAMGVVGVLGMGYILRGTITNEKYIEERMNLPVVAVIPEVNEKRIVKKHKRELNQEKKMAIREMTREDKGVEASKRARLVIMNEEI